MAVSQLQLLVKNVYPINIQGIYTESGCRGIKSFSSLNCSSQVNKEGCLSFNDKDNTCSWNDTSKVCLLVFNRSMSCLEYVDVSPNTCSLA